MNDPLVELLLVDDSRSDLDLALMVLPAALEIQAQAVDGGQAALDFLWGQGRFDGRPHAPRLVLLDLKMPGLNGLDVLQQLRAHPRTALQPVVMLSASDSPDDIAACYRAGANGYLVKPIGLADFSRLLERTCAFWLRENRQARE